MGFLSNAKMRRQTWWSGQPQHNYLELSEACAYLGLPNDLSAMHMIDDCYIWFIKTTTTLSNRWKHVYHTQCRDYL